MILGQICFMVPFTSCVSTHWGIMPIFLIVITLEFALVMTVRWSPIFFSLLINTPSSMAYSTVAIITPSTTTSSTTSLIAWVAMVGPVRGFWILFTLLLVSFRPLLVCQQKLLFLNFTMPSDSLLVSFQPTNNFFNAYLIKVCELLNGWCNQQELWWHC